MKNILLPLALAFFAGLQAQVGINTPTPQSTLDVTSKDPTGTATSVDGLLIPRVDRQRAQSMSGVPNSTLIYVNSLTGTAAGLAANVDALGYYYFDTTANAWQKLDTNPWFINGTTNRSNTAADNIYHTGRVMLGNSNGFNNGKMTINSYKSSIDNVDLMLYSYGTSAVTGQTGVRIVASAYSGTGVTPLGGALADGDRIFGLDMLDGNSSTTGVARIEAYRKGSNSNDLRFSTSGFEALRITEGRSVGIGFSTDNASIPTTTNNAGRVLQIASGTAGSSGLRLKNISNATTAVTTGVAPLGVDANGDVVVTSSSAVVKTAVRAVNSGTITVNNNVTPGTAPGAATETFDNLNEFNPATQTFTASQAGTYRVMFTAQFAQRANTSDGGDGYLAAAGITTNAATAPIYAYTKVPLAESGAGTSLITSTANDLLKLTAGQSITFYVNVFGATSPPGPTLQSYLITIERVD